jgi:hypothetical protein
VLIRQHERLVEELDDQLGFRDRRSAQRTKCDRPLKHWGTAERVPDGDARYRLVYITRALLHLIVLSELGMSAETQRRLVNDELSYSAERFRDAVRDHAQRQ